MLLFSLFLLINIINSIVNFGKPSAYLSCGIFGFSGRGSIEKIKMLGVLNDSRGGDGTGYFYNNEIVKGVFTEKKFADLVKKNKIKQKKAKVFIGHTRKATAGSHTEENTHPFIVDDMLVLAHNGVIYNIDELCKKYDVDNSKIHVDSKALAHLIHKVGFSVLEEYIGYAALAFTYKDKPDSLFLYHGKSKETNYTTAVAVEERPLFYMQTKEALYFSSLQDSLSIIQDNTEDKIETLNHNVVFEIKDGEFTDNYFVVKRESTNEDLWDFKYPNTYKNKSTTYTTPTTHNTPATSQVAQGSIGFPRSNSYTDKKLNINFQALPTAFQEKQSLFYYKGRHYITSEALGNSLQLANGVIFANKAYNIWRREIITLKQDGPKDYVHSDSLKVMYDGKEITLTPYYFYEGIMLRSKAAYNKVVGALSHPESAYYNLINPQSLMRLTELSRLSKYPITYNDLDIKKPSDPFIWLFEGRRATATGLKPQFSEIQLFLSEGSLVDYKKVKDHRGDEALSQAEEECNTPITDASMLVSMSKLTNIAIDMFIRDMCETFMEYRNANERTKELSLMTAKKDFLKSLYRKTQSIAEVINSRKSDKDGLFDMDSYLLWTTQILDSEHCPRIIDVFFSDDEFDERPVDNSPSVTETVVSNDGVIEIKQGNKTTIKIDGRVYQEEDDHFIDTFPESTEMAEADEEEVDSEVEYYLKDDPILRIADSLQPYDNSEFGQEVAHMFYLASDSIRNKLKELSVKHNKEELIKAILKQEKNN